MQIIIVSRCTQEFSSSKGGADALAALHAAALLTRGHRVTFIARDGWKAPNAELIGVRTRSVFASNRTAKTILGQEWYRINELLHVLHASIVGAIATNRLGADVTISNHYLTNLVMKFISPRTRPIYVLHDSFYSPSSKLGVVDRLPHFLDLLLGRLGEI